MAVADLTHVSVSENALVAFIEQVTVVGASDIHVSQGDKDWYVTYRPPFTRDIKKKIEEPDKEYATPYSISECQSCARIKVCADKKSAWTYCYGRLYTQKSCSAQMIAEADCDGDINKCGGICHG